MATWIAHLRIAENMIGWIPDLDEERFAVGNIAPDSGIPDEKWQKFTPPAHVSHFGIEGNYKEGLADLNFFRAYVFPLRPEPEKSLFSFRLGYFFHLVTDNLWNNKIGIPTEERWAVEFAADKDFIWEVKKDWYGLDHIYVRDHPKSLFWRVFLQAQPETGGLDFLLFEGIKQRVEYIQEFYQRCDEKIKAYYSRPFIYLSKEEMDRFVADTSEDLKRIFDRIWVVGTALNGYRSALEL
jgi:hypothetical protein